MKNAVLIFMLTIVFHYFGVEVGVAQSVMASFDDPRCEGETVCPTTPLLFTCTVTGSMASLASVRLPSGEVVNIRSDDTTAVEEGGTLPDGVVVQSHSARIEDGLANYMLALTIESASILNGNNVTCDDRTLDPTTANASCHVSTDTPGPPVDPSQIVSANTQNSTEIRWQHPEETGGSGIYISNYTVTVSNDSHPVVYERTVIDDARDNGTFTHTISGLDYNTTYSVGVTAINSCGFAGELASTPAFIKARVPSQPTSISVEMDCNITLNSGRPVTFNWMRGNQTEDGAVYPGVERATVYILTESQCSAKGSTSCETDIYSEARYNVSLTLENDFGAAEPVFYSFSSEALLEEDNLSDNLSDTPPSVNVTVNKNCSGHSYKVTVQFGVRKVGSQGCSPDPKETTSVLLTPGSTMTFKVNTSSLMLMKDYEYCFNATLEEVPSTTKSPTSRDSGLSTAATGGIAAGAAFVFILGVIGIILAVIIYYKCFRKTEKDDQEKKALGTNSPDSPAPTDQDPSTISRAPHPTTGELYTQVDLSNKKKEASQDPSTIEHQEAPGGELYAMPQKPSKKGKKEKKEEETHELSEEEKAALYSVPNRKGQKAKNEGLTYAQLDIHPSNKQAPPSQGSTYADIRL